MERLTTHDPDRQLVVCSANYKSWNEIYDRLAAYEDAGLTPEEIEELLAFAKFVARQAIDTGDNDGVSAEILCRKLNKLGLIETDGEFWMIPAPPKGVE